MICKNVLGILYTDTYNDCIIMFDTETSKTSSNTSYYVYNKKEF